MKNTTNIVFILILLFSFSGWSTAQDLSDAELLKLYDGLRVADVSDGMDYIGLHDLGLVDPSIEALWKDIDEFKHMFTGIAMTVRYVPTNREFPSDLRGEEYEKWRDHWYTVYSGEPFIDSITPGSVVVIDNAGNEDVGSVGSNNSMIWVTKGAVGIVSNGGIRDTDEVIKQQIPVYLNVAKRGRGIRPGRNELESVNKPVVIGGVTIFPGDVIVADGDGVIVVPRKHAVDVA
ncbi:MAG: RraA family protein, partial [Bacteroidales bacterium]